jgi:outer membrane protein assembly factor BamB
MGAGHSEISTEWKLGWELRKGSVFRYTDSDAALAPACADHADRCFADRLTIPRKLPGLSMSVRRDVPSLRIPSKSSSRTLCHFPVASLWRSGVLLAAICAPWTAFAQGFQSRFSMPEGLLMTAPREIEVLLGDAQESISKEQWGEAVVALGQLLGLEDQAGEQGLGEDYFMPLGARGKEGSGTILGEAKRLLESLPKEAQQSVELRYGVRARQLLENAIEQEDAGLLRQVASRYSFTEAGLDAGLLLSNRDIANGSVATAAATLERLVDQPRARERFGPSLGVLALATKSAVVPQADALRFLERVREYFPNVSVDWDGAKIGWNDKTTAESILESVSKEPIKRVVRSVRWPMFEGGQMDRNANTLGGRPVPILRWLVDLHESTQHKENLERTMRKQISERKSHVIPTRVPVATGNGLVLIPSYDQRILAIDTRSGKIRWPIVFSGTPLGFSFENSQERDGYSLGLPAPDYLVRRVWGDFTTSQISVDNERIYSVSETSALEVGESFAVGQNGQLGRGKMIRTNNVLQAWSLPEEGKLLWECGGVSTSSAPELTGALFLGAPLPTQTELLVIAEINGEVYLISLVPATGKMRWKQPLAANQGTTISLDPQRKSFGLTPTIDGSLVLCPTLSGFLVAYDLDRRELAWNKSYPLNASLTPGAAFNFVGGMDVRETDPMMSRPLNTFVISQDGVSVFAPSNGTAIYGVSNADGSELWQIGLEENTTFRFIAGVWNQVAVLVYAQEIVGIDLKTGQPAWTPIPFPGGAQVVGKCVRSDSKLFVPLSTQQLMEIDLVQGAILSTTRTERALGNLTVVGNQLLSTSPYELTCYSLRDPFQQELLDELKRSGQTPLTLLKQGELDLASGNIDGALTNLEQALEGAPNDRSIQRSLVKAASIALRSDFDRYVDRVRKYQALTFDMDLPSYLRIVIHGLEQKERWSEAFEKLLELSDGRMHRRVDQMNDSQDVDVNNRWSIQEDSWISARLARTAEKVKPEDWGKLGKAIEERLSPEATRDPSVMRLRLQHFDGLPYTDEARLRYVKTLGNRSLIDAEYLIPSKPNKLQPNGWTESFTKEVQRVRASIYLRGERPMKAWLELGQDNDAFIELAKSFTGRYQPGVLRFNEQSSLLERFAARQGVASRVASWPEGKVVVTSSFDQRNLQEGLDGVHESSHLCPVVERIGTSFEGWQVYFHSGLLQLFNRTTGEDVQYLLDVTRSDRTVVPRVYALESLLVVEMKDQLFAIDLFHATRSEQDGQLWTLSFANENIDSAVDRGRGRSNTIERNTWGMPVQRRAFKIAAISHSGVVVQSNDELVSYSPLNGLRQWALQGFKNASFVRKENVLYAFVPGTNKIQVIDLRDGLVTEQVATEQEGWAPIATVANRWIFSPMRTGNTDPGNRMRLRLVEPSSGEILIQADHTIDTRLAIADEIGAIALRTDGTMTYWDARKGTEVVQKVEVEGKFSSISAQVFGDVALVLPYAGSMELERVVVAPLMRTDPSVAACAGRMFAVNLKDGSLAWTTSQPVKHFMFPLSQNRESPAAVFLRRLTLSNVRGMALDFTSIALVDVRTGRLLYQKHDLPAQRGDAFRQQLYPSVSEMQLRYQGNLIKVRWTDETWESPEVGNSEVIGELDIEKFQSSAESMLEKLQTQGNIPGSENQVPQPLFPPPR